MAVPRVGLVLRAGRRRDTADAAGFHKEIVTEIVTMQAEAAGTYRVSLERPPGSRTFRRCGKRIKTAEPIVASGG